MGLFSRRDNSEAELAAMRATIDELRDELRHELTARADASEANEKALRDQLADARAEQRKLGELLTTLRDEHDGTVTGLTAVQAQLTPAVDDLDARLRALQQRLDTPMSPPPPTPPPTPGAEPAEVHAITTQLARLDERLAAVDRRVTSVSTELANQLAEMSSDIEALDRAAEEAALAASADPDDTADGEPAAAGPTIDPELLDELRDAQMRLANEQARYQIAFRDDLARLAEQLKRR